MNRDRIAVLCGLASWCIAGYILVRSLFSMGIEIGSPADLGASFGFGPWALLAWGAALLVLLALHRFLRSPRELSREHVSLSRRVERPLVVLVLALHGFLVWGYSWDLPLFEGPDEKAHFDYARYIAGEGELPSLSLDPDDGADDIDIDQKIQPPGYYLLLAPLMKLAGTPRWSIFLTQSDAADLMRRKASMYRHASDELKPYRGDVRTLHLLRLSGLLFSLLALLGLRRALRQARIGRAVALSLLAVVALLPQLLHVSGVFSNDLPAIALGAWIAAIGLRWTRRRALSRRSALALGLLLGAAMVSKLSAFVFLPWLALVLGLGFLRRDTRRGTLRAALLVLLGCALSSGWYWALNWHLYDHPLQNWVFQNAKQAPEVLLGAWDRWAVVFPATFSLTFFCDLGWARAWPSPWVLIALGVLLAVWLLPLATAQGLRWGIFHARGGAARAMALALLALAWAAQIKFNAAVFQPYGRHHFPFLAAYAILGACALEFALARFALRPPARALAIGAPALAFLLFALYGWFGVVRTQFYPLVDASDPYLAITDEVQRSANARVIEVLAPADGAQFSEPAVFIWRAEEGGLYSFEMSLDGDLDGPDYRLSSRVLRSYEILRIPLRAGTHSEVHPSSIRARVPEAEGSEVRAAMSFAVDYWKGLPADEAIAWRVRKLTPVRHPEPSRSRPRIVERAP